MGISIYFWIGFHLFIFFMLALDLGVFHKKTHKVPVKEALIWSAVWISLALLFNLFVLFEFGKTKALEFLTGYVIEYSLSVDNIFVFILIFSYFAVKGEYQHKILFWGILGALIMRGIFIFAGVALINRFHWIVIIFGGFLVYSGIAMLFQKETAVDPDKNAIVKFFRKFLPVTDTIHGNKLFVRQNKKIYATPLFLVLLVIESSDLIFAVDSIPAILAISKDSFIVYTSNIFAIMGLRSLYFAVSGIMGLFRYLKVGLAFVLTFVGLKMLAAYFEFEIPIVLSLLVIISILVVSILASVVIKEKK
ncbi:MAG: TerC family protein [Bacteroidales bacterium]|nr:TerC family protein [Bacteroidales bacterium]